MLTGGESGIISVWKKREAEQAINTSTSRSFKEKSNIASKMHDKRKPY
jgi:hypothetical protein